MADFLKDGLRRISQAGRRALREATSESSVRRLRRGVTATRENAEETARVVAQSPVAQQAASAARFAATSGPVKQVAYICGRAGVAGAMVDGAMGGLQSLKAMQDGRVGGRQAIIHTGAEAGCGFVTSSSGTAGTIVAYMLTGSMGPAALAAGMGASVGSRYVYRQIVGDTLPQNGAEASADDGSMEDIGPQDE